MNIVANLLFAGLVAVAVFGGGCQTGQRDAGPSAAGTRSFSPPLLAAPPGRMFVPARPIVAGAWMEEAKDWVGTPCLAGGLTHSGVDGPGLVFQLYRAVAGVTLPRTCRQQWALGVAVAATELRPGDLVFFQATAAGPAEVALALGGRQLLMATAQKGVILVSLNEPHYADRYFAAKRLLP